MRTNPGEIEKIVNSLTPLRFGSNRVAACLIGVLASIAAPGLAQVGSPPGFSNPPLLYEGPDPTANYFLPANSALPNAATVTPLPPPEFSASPPSSTPISATPAAPAERFAPPLLTPSAVIRRFSLPGLPHAGQSETGLPATRPETVLPGTFGETLGQREVIFPAEVLDDSPSSRLPHGDFFALDPLARHDGGITDHKDGFFQSFNVTGTWIDRNNKPDDFGVTELEIRATFAVPLPTKDWPLLLTPAFTTRFLDGPPVVNLPPRLYETYLDFTWIPRLSSRWTAIVGVAPSVYSDFASASDGFRVTGKGLVRYDWQPGKLQIILGVLYLGRADAVTLPAAGVIWTPDDRRKYELLFPRPKLAHLIRREARYEDWMYLGAEFGGNSFEIERIPGTSETITLRDYRAYLGLERKLNGGAGFRLEVGYVWGRVIEFDAGLPDLNADSTAMIRGGITF